MIRCSEASLAVGEPLAGTAVDSVRTWFLLELNHVWARKAIETEAIGGAVRRQLEAWLGAVDGSRLQLIRRPGRPSRRPTFTVVDAVSKRLSRVELDDPQDLAALDIQSLLADGSPMTQSMALVCVHGRRDRCCAEHGSAVFRAMARRDVDVWQTSHLGGHRFAACALWLPDGLMFGRLRAEHVDAFVDAHRARALGELDLFRGRCAYDRPTQAAEIFLRRRERDLAIDSLAWRSTDLAGDSSWRVRFAAGENEHEIDVVREASDAVRPASCGGEPEPVSWFIEGS